MRRPVVFGPSACRKTEWLDTTGVGRPIARRSLLALALAQLMPAVPVPKPQNIVFLSGEANPLKLAAQDQRFFVTNLRLREGVTPEQFNAWRAGRLFYVTEQTQ